MILCTYIYIYVCVWAATSKSIEPFESRKKNLFIRLGTPMLCVCVLYVNQEGVVVLSLNMS